MWIPSPLVNYFATLNNAASSNTEHLSEVLAGLREDLAVLRAERDLLRNQLTISQTQFDWLRMRTNALEVERAILLSKVTGLPFAAPEIVRTPAITPDLAEQSFSFEDLGDKLAKQLHLDN